MKIYSSDIQVFNFIINFIRDLQIQFEHFPIYWFFSHHPNQVKVKFFIEVQLLSVNYSFYLLQNYSMISTVTVLIFIILQL